MSISQNRRHRGRSAGSAITAGPEANSGSKPGSGSKPSSDALAGLREAVAHLDSQAFAGCFCADGWIRVPRPEGDVVLRGPGEIEQIGHELSQLLVNLTWTPSQRFVAAGQVVEEAVAQASTAASQIRVPMRVVAALDSTGQIGSLTLWVDWAALRDPLGVDSARGAASALVAQARARDTRGLRVIESEFDTAALPPPLPPPDQRTVSPPRPPATALWWKRHRATLTGSAMALAAMAVIGWVAVTALQPILDDEASANPAAPTASAAVLGAEAKATSHPNATCRPSASELPVIIREKPRARPTEQAGKTYDLKARFLFGTGSTDLTAAARTKLRKVAATIRAEQVIGNVQVNGYTDEVGKPADNLSLSRSRAQAVAEALRVELGGVAVKLSPQGFGERLPADTNSTPEGRANNRRVVIVLPEPKTSPSPS